MLLALECLCCQLKISKRFLNILNTYTEKHFKNIFGFAEENEKRKKL